MGKQPYYKTKAKSEVAMYPDLPGSYKQMLLKYVLICELNFEFVAVTRPCIKFFSFR